MTIQNYGTYTSGMLKSMADKLFFLDHFTFDTLVDFGCADGALIKYLAALYPEQHFIGYDYDTEMLRLASESKPANVTFTSNWDDVLVALPKGGRRSALLMSSVVHEIYSYSPPISVAAVWNKVFSAGFDYIAIRDMCVSRYAHHGSNPLHEVVVRNKYEINGHRLDDFERVWGSIKSNVNLIHYLLKYRYVENWERELHENYLPLTLEELRDTLEGNGYAIDYQERYTLPFLKEQVWKDFHIELTELTHLKMILSKEDTE